MNLTQCPYDGARIEVEVGVGVDESLVLTCVACGAAWERTRARVTARLREPDADRLRRARSHVHSVMPAEPLPMAVDVRSARGDRPA